MSKDFWFWALHVWEPKPTGKLVSFKVYFTQNFGQNPVAIHCWAQLRGILVRNGRSKDELRVARNVWGLFCHYRRQK
jgi:hypothetical protein